MTQKEFRADESLTRLWRETWQQPHMKLGREILLSAYLPTKVTEIGDPMALHALEHARCEGFFDYHRFIDVLGQRFIPQADEPEPWAVPSSMPDND